MVAVCKFSLKTAGNGVILSTNLADRLAVLFDRMQKIATKTDNYRTKTQNTTNQLTYSRKERLHPPLLFDSSLVQQCNFASHFAISWAIVLPHSFLPQFCYISLGKSSRKLEVDTHTDTQYSLPNMSLFPHLSPYISFPKTSVVLTAT